MALQVVMPASPVSALVASQAVRVRPDCTIAEVARVMGNHGVSSVLVGDESGIATERDLVRALAAGVGPDEAIAAVATAHPVRVSGDCSVMDAGAAMLNEEVRHLIVEIDDAVGIVSLREVMAVLLCAVNPRIWLTRLRVAVAAPSEIWLGSSVAVPEQRAVQLLR